MVDDAHPENEPTPGPAPLVPPGDSGEHLSSAPLSPQGAIGPSVLFGATGRAPWDAQDPFGAGSAVPPSGPPLGSAPYPGAPPPARRPRSALARWAWVLGSLSIGLVLVLAVWAVATGLRDAGGNLTEWEPYEPEFPGDEAPSEEHPPEDAVLSEEQIRAAFATAFDQTATPEQWTAVVNAPVETGERLKTLAAGCGNAQLVVGRVAFTSPQEAAVEFRFQGSPVPGGDGVLFSGNAERVTGKWMVTGWTIEEVITAAAPFCR